MSVISEDLITPRKFFTIKKVTPSDILFSLSPVSNNSLTRVIHLTDRMPQQNLPLDWALGIFVNESLYSMYKEGYFTFDDNDALVKAAVEAGVYFDEVLDFEPADPAQNDEIFAALKSGVKPKIDAMIEKFGVERVKTIAIKKANELSVGVVSVLERIFHIQLTMDGASE